MGVKKGEEHYLEVFKKVHNDKYKYPNFKYSSNRDKIDIVCPIHGQFTQSVSNHNAGKGCNKCAREKVGISRRSKVDSLKTIFIEVHQDKFSYERFIEYTQAHEKIDIFCKRHNEYFSQSVNSHKRGTGCPKCGKERSEEAKCDDLESFILKANAVHNYVFGYSKAKYTCSKTPLIITCEKHGDFKQIPNGHLNGNSCPKCNNNKSKAEDEIFNFIKEYHNVIQSDKSIIKSREIDIFIPSLNIAVEYNGIHWHSDKFVKQDYHKEKLKLCQDKDIRLIQIFEDEWLYKKSIVKSRILNIIGKTKKRVFARKCIIKEVSSLDASNFLEENHIQGKVNSRIKIGLYHEDELVSLMTLGGLRKNLGQSTKEGSYELLRFCNKVNTTVVGGASKLNKYFEKTYKPIEIISYADLRWSEGELYKNLGFTLLHETEPNYFYTKGVKRENRFKYRKSELVKKGADKSKTEKQIMEEAGFSRIYDAGALKFCKLFN